MEGTPHVRRRPVCCVWCLKLQLSFVIDHRQQHRVPSTAAGLEVEDGAHSSRGSTSTPADLTSSDCRAECRLMAPASGGALCLCVAWGSPSHSHQSVSGKKE
jgi:hypothetical protein